MSHTTQMSLAVAAFAYGLYFMLRKRGVKGGGGGGGAARGAPAITAGAGGGGGGLAGRIRGFLTKWCWWVPSALLLIANASMANTVVGVWSAKILGGLLGFVGGWFHVHAALIAGVAFLLLFIATVWDLVIDHKPDGIAKVGLVLLPVLVLIAAGPMPAHGRNFFDSVDRVSTSQMHSLIRS